MAYEQLCILMRLTHKLRRVCCIVQQQLWKHKPERRTDELDILGESGERCPKKVNCLTTDEFVEHPCHVLFQIRPFEQICKWAGFRKPPEVSRHDDAHSLLEVIEEDVHWIIRYEVTLARFVPLLELWCLNERRKRRFAFPLIFFSA